MAVSKTCDKCGQEAVTSVRVESGMTTTVQVDLCGDCFSVFKRFVHWLTGQEQEEFDQSA